MATNSFTEFNLAETQRLADYTSIQVDLQSACEFARTMLAEMHRPSPNYSLADPFMVATIIRYARAFSQGIRLKLYDAASSTLTDEQFSKHQYFMALRDKYIAHSVNAFEESQPVARYWVERVHEEGITSIECNHRRISGLSEQDFHDIVDLASTWLVFVKQKLTEEKARLLPIVRKIPLEQLFQNAPTFTPGPDTSKPQKKRITTSRTR